MQSTAAFFFLLIAAVHACQPLTPTFDDPKKLLRAKVRKEKIAEVTTRIEGAQQSVTIVEKELKTAETQYGKKNKAVFNGLSRNSQLTNLIEDYYVNARTFWKLQDDIAISPAPGEPDQRKPLELKIEGIVSKYGKMPLRKYGEAHLNEIKKEVAEFGESQSETLKLSGKKSEAQKHLLETKTELAELEAEKKVLEYGDLSPTELEEKIQDVTTRLTVAAAAYEEAQNKATAKSKKLQEEIEGYIQAGEHLGKLDFAKPRLDHSKLFWDLVDEFAREFGENQTVEAKMNAALLKVIENGGILKTKNHTYDELTAYNDHKWKREAEEAKYKKIIEAYELAYGEHAELKAKASDLLVAVNGLKHEKSALESQQVVKK